MGKSYHQILFSFFMIVFHPSLIFYFSWFSLTAFSTSFCLLLSFSEYQGMELSSCAMHYFQGSPALGTLFSNPWNFKVCPVECVEAGMLTEGTFDSRTGSRSRSPTWYILKPLGTFKFRTAIFRFASPQIQNICLREADFHNCNYLDYRLCASKS